MTDALSDLIGHERVVARLRTMIAHGTLPHAAIFHGPRHVGKAALAEALAAALLGVERAGETHPDFRRLERPRDEKTGKLKKFISIESVRDLQAYLRMSAFLGGAKVAVIDGADRLSEEAANALLKILEEPPARTYVLMCAEDLARLPETIVSRAMTLGLRRLPEAELARVLEARGLAPFEASRAAARSDGRPGLALGFLAGDGMVSWYEAEERRWSAFRGAPAHRRLAECADLAPARGDREETVERLRDLFDLWQSFLRRDLKAGAPAAEPNLRRLLACRASLDANVQPRLLLEKFVLTLDRPV